MTQRRLVALIVVLIETGSTAALAAPPRGSAKAVVTDGAASAADTAIDVFTPVTEVTRVPGQPVRIVVGRGSEVGILAGRKGDLYDLPSTVGLGRFLGTIEVVEVLDGSAVLRIPPGSHVPPALVAKGQTVGIKARPPTGPHRELADLDLLGITFIDNAREPFADGRELQKGGAAVDAKVLAAMSEALHEVVEFTTTFTTRITHGKWKGMLIKDILAAAGPDDVLRFLRFVRDYPGKYLAHSWKISETFATWLINDADNSFSDGIEELLASPSPSPSPSPGQSGRGAAEAQELLDVKELRKAFAAVHIPESSWSYDKDAKARALLKLLEKLATARAARQPALAARLDGMRALLLERGANKGPAHSIEVARAHRSAGQRYAAAGLLPPANTEYSFASREFENAFDHDAVLATVEEFRAFLLTQRSVVDAEAFHTALSSSHDMLTRATAVLLKRGLYQRVLDELLPLVELYRTTRTSSSIMTDELDVLDAVAEAQRKLGRRDEAQQTYALLEKSAGKDPVKLQKLAFAVADTRYEQHAYAEALLGFHGAAQMAHVRGDLAEEARGLAAAGQTLWQLGRLKEALDEHDHAMRLREQVGDRSGIAWQRLQLARIRTEMGDRAAARDELTRALAVYVELGDQEQQASVTMELAGVSCELADGVRCQREFASARALYHALKFAPDEARAILGEGRAIALGHDYAGAARTVAQAAAIHERLGDKPGLAVDLEWLGRLQGSANDRVTARATLDKALRTDEGVRFAALVALASLDEDDGLLEQMQQHLDAATAAAGKDPEPDRKQHLADLRGSLHEQRGEYAEALAVAEERIALARASGNRPALVAALQGRGWMLAKVGRLAESKQSSESALALAREIGDQSQEAWSLNAIAAVAGAYGDRKAQLAAYDESIPLMRKAGDRYGEAAMTFNRSLLLVELRDLDGALAENSKASELSRLTSTRELEIALLSSRGQILGLQKHYAEADALLGQALAAARKAAPERVPSLLVELAGNQAKRSDYRAALVLLDEAVKLEEARSGKQYRALSERGKTQALAGDDGAAEKTLLEVVARAKSRGGVLPWESLYYLGLVRSRGGHSDEALATLERCVKEIERAETVLGDDRARAQYRADKVDAYHLLIKLLLAKGRVEDGLRYLEQAKAGELADVARRSGGAGDPQSAFALELEAQEGRVQALVDGERAKPKPDDDKLRKLDDLLDGIKRRRAEYIDKLERENPRLFDRFAVRPLELEKLQKYIPEGMLLVSPVVLDDRVVIFAVTGKAVTHVESTVKAGEVDRLVTQFLDETDPRKLIRDDMTPADIERAIAESLVRVEVPARRLYELLLKPVFAAVGRPRVLAVSASGTLRYLPFGALHDEEGWLASRLSAVSVSALGSYELSSPRAHQGDPSVLALADPDGSLPAARGEVQAIRAVLSHTQVFEGKDATQAMLRDTIRRHPPDIVHLATHGFLDAANPERSRILLAGKELSYPDIPSLDLGKVRLIVLSACDTMQRGKGSGVEMAGLASQFERAKVSSVLATYWSVNDQATSDLMGHFYEGLKRGHSLADSLAEAQRALMASSTKAYRHPAFWAPFVLMGSP